MGPPKNAMDALNRVIAEDASKVEVLHHDRTRQAKAVRAEHLELRVDDLASAVADVEVKDQVDIASVDLARALNREITADHFADDVVGIIEVIEVRNRVFRDVLSERRAEIGVHQTNARENFRGCTVTDLDDELVSRSLLQVITSHLYSPNGISKSIYSDGLDLLVLEHVLGCAYQVSE